MKYHTKQINDSLWFFTMRKDREYDLFSHHLFYIFSSLYISSKVIFYIECLIFSSYICSLFSSVGFVCSCMTFCGLVWFCVFLYGLVWSCMVLNGWSCVVLYCPVWSCTVWSADVLYVLLWACMYTCIVQYDPLFFYSHV